VKVCAQFTCPLRDEEVFLMVKESTIVFTQTRIGGGSMSKGILKLAMERFKFLVISLVHRIGALFGGGEGRLSEVGIRFKGCLPNIG
jgi:hypothetical protein